LLAVLCAGIGMTAFGAHGEWEKARPAVKRVNGFWAISPCFTNPRSVATTASYGTNFERFSEGVGCSAALKMHVLQFLEESDR
jgi:hypothetical protein